MIDTMLLESGSYRLSLGSLGRPIQVKVWKVGNTMGRKVVSLLCCCCVVVADDDGQVAHVDRKVCGRE